MDVDPSLIGQDVVIDTSTPLIYLGRLTGVDGAFLVLEDVDVHDVGDTPTTKDIYILEARKHGVRKNRSRACLSTAHVVSISRLDEVVDY